MLHRKIITVYDLINTKHINTPCEHKVEFLDVKFAGSNPAEAVGFLRAKKSSARLPSEGK